MKKPLLILLLLSLAFEATSADIFGKRKNKKRKKAKTEQVDSSTLVQPAPEAQPRKKKQTEAQSAAPVVTDLTLKLTAEEADSLVAAWYEYCQTVKYDDYFNRIIRAEEVTITGTDEAAWAQKDALYKQRLQDLVSPIPLAYNRQVRDRITGYVEKWPSTTSRIIGLSQLYFPMIEEELLRNDLPIELRALPIIESAMQTGAVSRAAAVGLWQFIASTGKSYGLEINSLVDERRDPLRSTEAACRFLKDLYRIYGDWTLVIAAYNCGPGNVNKALARSGGKTFWQIYDYLPHETRGYVPAFIAATYAFNYHRQHGIEPTPSPIPLALDTIKVHRITHFEQIASTIDVKVETLRQLNPQYRLDIIPASTKPYTLVLPQRNVAQYIEHEEAIMAKDSLYLKEYLNPTNLDKKRQEQSVIIYRVKRGDTLGGIARRHGVTVKQLMRWNGIKNAARIREGQRLRIEK